MKLFGTAKKQCNIVFIFSLTLCFAKHAQAAFLPYQYSAFEEFVEVQPKAVIQLQFSYSTLNPAYVTTSATESGTVTALTNFAVMQTGTTPNSSATLLSRQRLHYQTGQGCYAIFTSVFTTGVADSTQITGIGNTQDGFFFGYNGTAFGILHRVASQDTWIAQTSWNKDKFNGSGASGVILAPTNGNVYKIQYQWLGYGAINFFIENPNTGGFTLVHQIQYANANATTSLLNPSLQLMSQAKNGSSATNITIRVPSMAAFIEGVTGQLDERNDISNAYSATTTPRNALTIRNNSQFNSLTNQVIVYPDLLTIYNSTTTANRDILCSLYLNPTVAGTPSFTDISASSSVVSYDIAGTTVSGGRLLFSFYIADNSSVNINLSDYGLYLVPTDTLVFVVNTFTSTSTVYVNLAWHENF